MASFTTTPVFAEPETNTDTSETTENIDTSETTENAETESTETESTEAEGTTDSTNTDTTANEDSSDSEEDEELTNTCTDTLGNISWLICPITNAIATGVDTIYNIIGDLLAIKPISSESDSPVYIVWNYARGITNIIFIIFLIIMVYSQITGFGISNYGVKKTLPRVIVVAVLINLSFIICALAVDLSNIIGFSLSGFFDSVKETVASNSSFSDLSWSEVLAWIIGGGTATIAGLSAATVAAGGFAALLWMAIPLLIAAIGAVFVGLFTIALRQGVIALLTMIAPLAFVCFLLPNTEKYFKMWKDMFIRMLVFYPLFSLLFGASSLAGWVLIYSADNMFWVLIGLAVQVLPFFLAFSLMKMSGTILSTVSDKLSNLSKSASGASRNFASEQRALQRARVAAKPKSKNPLAIRNAMQAMEKRKFRRASDTAKYQAVSTQRYTNYAETLTNKKGELTRRGKKVQAAEEEAAAYKAVGTELTRRKVQNRYDRAHAAIVAKTNGQITDHYRRMSQIATSTGLSEDAGISAIVAGAISEQVSANKSALGDYEDLYSNAIVSSDVQKEMDMIFASKNAVALQAGLSSLVTTGDNDKIRAILRQYTPAISSTNIEDIAMQKAISTALRKVEGDEILKGYSKAVDKSRNKADAINSDIDEVEARNLIHAQRGEPLEELGERMANFVTFGEYEDNATPATKLGVDQDTILSTNNKINVAALQDKAVWDDAKDHNKLPFTAKQRAYAIFNEPGGGETYEYLLDVHLGKAAKWRDKDTRQVLTIKPTTDANGNSTPNSAALNQACSQVHEVISKANSKQISQFNSASLGAFATVLSGDYTVDADGTIVFDNSDPADRRQRLVEGVKQMLPDFRPNLTSDLHKRSERGQLEDMDPEVRSILNEVLHFE